MKYKVAEDAKPQLILLLIATIVTVALWFIPYAEYLVYPIRLFVTFIHESSHALMAFVTGGSVQSLTISSDGSGVVYSAASGWLSGLLTSSAGYIGTTVFGVLMLFLIRRAVTPQKVLVALGIFVGVMTLVFGVISPAFHILSLNVPVTSVIFTVFAGVVLSAGLVALGIFANFRVASFSVAFLAIQCLLNALSDLKTVFLVNAPFSGDSIQNDASNMAAATGLPGIVWVVIWIFISIAMISLGLRLYAVVKRPGTVDNVFED